jgi:hypothetical protein
VLISAAQAASSGDDWRVIAALIAATLAFTAHMVVLLVNGRRARRDRLRELYADGWAAIQAYKEMAFMIRRRNIDDRAGERVRLSAAMSEIQKELAYHEALIGRERAGRVAAEYRNLIIKTREVAGDIVRRSWDGEPITSDSEMHAPAIADRLAELKPFEDGYMDAVAEEIDGWRRPRP